MRNAAASLRRYALVLLVGSMTIVLGLWITWILGVVDSDGLSDPNGNPVGIDYAIFHTGGKILAEGDQAILYDEIAFVSELELTVEQDGLTSSPTFVNPPFFAAVFMPFADMGYRSGLAIWSVIGLLALGGSLWLTGTRSMVIAIAAALLFYPVFVAFRLGQNSFVSLFLLAACFGLLTRDKDWQAGIALGLLAYKPQLALGVAIWWTLDWRTYRRAWLAAAATALSLAVGGWLFWPEATSDYLTGFRNLVTATDPGFLRSTFSPYGFFATLLPGHEVVISILTAAAAIAGLAWFLSYWRNHRDDPAILFSLAVILTLWLSPRVVVYDWTLLLLPALVLANQRPHLKDTWLLLSGIVAMAATISTHFSGVQLDSWGWAVQVAVIALGIAAVGTTRALGYQDRQSTS